MGYSEISRLGRVAGSRFERTVGASRSAFSIFGLWLGYTKSDSVGSTAGVRRIDGTRVPGCAAGTAGICVEPHAGAFMRALTGTGAGRAGVAPGIDARKW